jgi:hypothetical protein
MIAGCNCQLDVLIDPDPSPQFAGLPLGTG